MAQHLPSIDSAISSGASGNNITPMRSNPPTISHSSKSPRETNSSSSSTVISSSTNKTLISDPSTLIKAAGNSPELAIHQLLKEKASTAQRNEQLWRLVEKQRAMILGLNKDLEKLAKENQKYRKRLKEMDKYAHVPPVPAVGAIAGALGRDRIIGTSPEDAAESRELDERATSSSVPEHSAQRNLHSSTTAKTPVTGSTGGAAQEVGLIKESLSRGHSTTSPVVSPKKSSQLEEILHSPGGTESRTGQAAASTVSRSVDGVSQPSSSPGASSLPERLRKAAPAPLDLSSPHKPSKPHIAARADSDSECDNIIDSGSSPIERGRLRTRHDDDRQRELVAVQEEEARSRSNKSSKSKKSKSRSKSRPKVIHLEDENRPVAMDADFPAGLAGGVGLPTSPRAALLGGLQSPLQQRPGGFISTAPSSQINAKSSTSYAHNSHPLKSPGLPATPRPGDRPSVELMPRISSKAIASPGPFSPRQGNMLSPRPPKQPIPLPPNTPLAANSRHLARAEAHHKQQPDQRTSISERLNATIPQTGADEILNSGLSASKLGQIYKGFVSEQYPHLLLPPNAIPLIAVKVHSSRLHPSRYSYNAGRQNEDDPIFTLAVYARSNNRQLWGVEKTLIALPMLDSAMRQVSGFNAKLPDRSLFSGHAPAKIDARRTALNSYFETMLNTPIDEKAALVLCDFFSTDVIAPETDASRGLADAESTIGNITLIEGRRLKHGYLTKRGKNFGGWKARFFILDDGPDLTYFDSPGGMNLGTIRLSNAQIGKQNSYSSEEDPENQHRHSLLILEPKRKDSSQKIRHLLCAESDEERDAWVEALLQRVDLPIEADSSYPEPPGSARGFGFSSRMPSKKNGLDSPAFDSASFHSVSYDDTVAADAPTSATIPPALNISPSPPASPKMPGSAQLSKATKGYANISSPVSGSFILNSDTWGNKPPATPREKESKKRGIFGFRSRSSAELVPGVRTDIGQGSGTRETHISERRHPSRAVFGIPLAEAAEMCAPHDVDICLPAPVYRCIEYLEAKDAINEEGIFRLSGSANVIKALKERFNTEGDVNLLAEKDYYDLHAVATLLKTYLRELPGSVLTRELHLDFLKVLDLDDKDQKIAVLNHLVQRLPEANFELLSTVFRYLIEVVQNSDVNRMNARNLGIVMSPTLNIPAPLVALFLTEHNNIFNGSVSPSTTSTASPALDQLHSVSALPTDEIRSPRKQMFVDLATPSYNQSTFGLPPSPRGLNQNNALQSPGYGVFFHSQPSNGAQQQQDLKAMYNTMSTPPKPIQQQQSQNYQHSPPITQVPDLSAGGYGNFGSLNAALQAAPTTATSPRMKSSSSSPGANERSNANGNDSILANVMPRSDSLKSASQKF